MKERIQERAYFLWDRAGRPEGKALNFWLAAEFEITIEDAQSFSFL